MGVARVVPEDVPNGGRRLRRRPQHVQVVAVLEHGAAPAHHRVETLRNADRQSAHSVPERPRPAGLDDRVDVIALDRVLDDPHVAPPPELAERAVDHRERALAPQAPDPGRHPQRHVNRLVRAELLSTAMRHAGTRAGQLPACALAATSPRLELERRLSRVPHEHIILTGLTLPGSRRQCGLPYTPNQDALASRRRPPRLRRWRMHERSFEAPSPPGWYLCLDARPWPIRARRDGPGDPAQGAPRGPRDRARPVGRRGYPGEGRRGTPRAPRAVAAS